MATNNAIDSNIPIPIVKGGTNSSSLTTTYGTIYYDSSSLSTLASTGTSGYVLKSNGASAPSFQTVGGSTPTALSVAFLANLSASVSSVTGDSTSYSVVWNNEVYDAGNDFNTTTGVFIAPSTSKYFFISCINIKGTSSNTSYKEMISTSNRDYAYVGNLANERYSAADSYQNSSAKIISVLADMDVSDIAVSKVISYGGAKNNDVLATSASYFCGYEAL